MDEKPKQNQSASRGGRWVVFVAGPSASGKTTIAKHVASELDACFIEGDEFHPKANIEKMHKGQPLTDSDREGWLEALDERVSSHPQDPGSRRLVISCSALKREYRDTLRHGCQQCGGDLAVHFLFLDAPEAVLQQRADNRKGHFASSDLVPTQFQALERPGIDELDTMVLSVVPPLDEVKASAIHMVSKMLSGGSG